MTIDKKNDFIVEEDLNKYFCDGPLMFEQDSKAELSAGNDWRSLVLDLISARKGLGLSQRGLEKISGIPQPAIARTEKLKSVPQLNTFLKLSQAMGLTLGVTNTAKTINDNSLKIGEISRYFTKNERLLLQEELGAESYISNDWRSLIFDLIDFRYALDLTQRDLEELSGIPQPAIARTEKLKCPPNLDTFLQLSQAMGLTLEVIDMVKPTNDNSLKVDEPIIELENE
ncbi:MAG TPA: hypothetical protein DCP90_03295 [Clostridiales bacterium]|nr:MAG: hypothetical protein A2Y22_03100 [Clostridiales bacterium GWD2_32_59]HAN09621.1 hypothetical protein [Clostridiales bacterium]